MINIIYLLSVITLSCGDVFEVLPLTEPPPPKPYAFGYAAGRLPGHIDRTHSEISDGSGVVQGSFSYVDPSYKIRTVDYTADKNGFHPILNFQPAPLPQDSEAVALARAKHLNQYAAIANRHQLGAVAVPLETAAVAHARQAHLSQYAAIAEAHRVVPGQVVVPIDSVANQHAAANHFNLYERIAAEHARIAHEREAERLAHEATAKPNHLE